MSLMCSMNGCREKKGLCIHEKMLAVFALMAAIGGIVFFLK